MRIRFLHTLGEFRWFWKLKHNKSKLAFLIKRQIFKITSSISWSRSATVILIVGVLLVIAAVAFVYSRGIGVVSLWRILWSVGVDSTLFVEGLSAMIALHGVLLGLHFTLVSGLITNIYPHASRPVISLITKEKSNYAYIWVNVISLIYAIALLLFEAHKFHPPLLLFLFSLSAGIVTLFALVKLGTKGFRLTDPTALAENPINEILLVWARGATRGFLANDKNFQNHFYILANKCMDKVEELVVGAIGRSKETSYYLVTFCEYLVRLASYYQTPKRKIHSQSYWFPRQSAGVNWYLADDSRLQIAYSTQTQISEEKVNHFWLEERVTELIKKILEKSLESPETLNSIGIADWVNTLMERLSFELETENTIKLIDEYRQMIEAHMEGISDQFIKAGLVDRASLFASTAFLGFLKFIRELDLDALEKKIHATDWCYSTSLFSLELPVAVIREVEYLPDRLEFEVSVEDRIVSPTWYRRDLLFKAMSNAFYNSLTAQVLFAETRHKILAAKLLKSEDHAAAVIACLSGLQHCQKILGNLDDIQAKVTNLQERCILQDLPWPTYEWDEYADRMNAAKHELEKIMAQCLYGIIDKPLHPDLPDLIGEVTSKTGEACFDALQRGDAKAFAILFPAYMHGAITCSNRTEKVLGITEEQFAHRRCVPTLDLLHLSGYALMYSELHGKPEIWRVCSRMWDLYMRYQTNATYISAAINFSTGTFGILPRGVSRTNWQMALQRDLSQLPTENVPSSGWIIGSRERVQHPSAIIRAVAGTHRLGDWVNLLHDGLAIFVMLYLKQHPVASQFDYGRRFEDDLVEEIRAIESEELGIDMNDINSSITDILNNPEDGEDDAS